MGLAVKRICCPDCLTLPSWDQSTALGLLQVVLVPGMTCPGILIGTSWIQGSGLTSLQAPALGKVNVACMSYTLFNVWTLLGLTSVPSGTQGSFRDVLTCASLQQIPQRYVTVAVLGSPCCAIHS